MVGLQAAQRLFKHLHGDIFAAAVGADFSHDESPIAFAAQGGAQAFFAEAVVIIPGVVEEIDAGVERAGDEFVRFLLVFR